MKLHLSFLLFIVCQGFVGPANRQSKGFDKRVFYQVMASGKAGEINAQLSVLGESAIPEKEAYEGALLMKKAGLAARAKDKLKLFKSGYVKLETSIARDSSNIEYRFLRLAIQEHAPKIVNYNKDLKKDSQDIYLYYSRSAPVVQKAILEYSKNSKILHSKDLNE